MNLVGETSRSVGKEVRTGYLLYDSLLTIQFALLVNDGFEDTLEEGVLAYILDSFLVFLEKPRIITESNRCKCDNNNSIMESQGYCLRFPLRQITYFRNQYSFA